MAQGTPPPGDPSEHTGPSFDDLPEDIAPANENAFDGGATGTPDDTHANNVVPQSSQRADGRFNIPTNGPPSPLFGALPFTQKMCRFEEFGIQPLDFNATSNNPKTLPIPSNAQSMPHSQQLDNFLSDEIFPLPTRSANTTATNPWESLIESYLGRPLAAPPAEGRPPGEGWAHQRWSEFTPQVYFKTAQTGARTNKGLRDSMQSHGYSVGEFEKKDGLYHNTYGPANSKGTTKNLDIKFHPNMPVQQEDSVWTFDGTLPPKLLRVRYGESVLMRHYNALPVDVSANRGFGLHTLSTHEHNGHNPAESDGYTNAFFFPGQFYDYRWPMVLAGHDSINVGATDNFAGSPDGNGGITKIRGDWRETMSTHWFHDHMLDFTAQNVYKGNAAMMNYYSAIDRGNEGLNDGVNLRLPGGTGLDWGNRDYDVNLMLAEKAWDPTGQLWFNPFNQFGFIGDVMTVNWLYKPYFDVRARRYRFRILNASVSRYFKLGLVDEQGNAVPFHMVANDGNIMEHTVPFADGQLPTLGIAERYDIVVDFGNFQPGDKLYLVNMLQHRNGQSTDAVIPMADILSGAYQATQVDENNDGTPDRWQGDPVVGKFMEFRVHAYSGQDVSMNPANYEVGKLKMIPLRRPTAVELDNALHRTFEFERQPTDDAPWVIETDGGKGFNMDPRRLSAAPNSAPNNQGGLEVWRLVNSGTWSHPIHIHFEEGIILRRNGVEPPAWEKWARKDVYRLGPEPDSGEQIEIALRFREFAGTYMEHCHNTQHEDHAMLLRWDIEHPGQVKMMPAPIPSWDGVSYVDTVALPTARTGDTTGQFGLDLDDQAVEIWLDGVEIEGVDLVNVDIGDAQNPTEDERAVAKIPLRKGINIDSQGTARDVYFVLHDISDKALAEEFGVAWAGALEATPLAASSAATYDPVTKTFTFNGDLPNPIIRPNLAFQAFDDPNTPAQSASNTYSPLRRVIIDGKNVVINAFFIQWGIEQWEHLRIDNNCTLPDEPANTACRYNGLNWGGDTGHAVEINTTAPEPYVKMKIHKSWTDNGDYLPYYLVVDSYPAGPANNMGVIYVPKHEHLGATAVPLVQFLPSTPLSGSYPPTPTTANFNGGGPLGGQIGLPSYFMPEKDYSPMWHIGFAHWLVPPTEVVKGLERLKELREDGALKIHEWPAASPTRFNSNDYDFANLNSPHVVNCPTPITIDFVVHKANKQSKASNP